MNNEITTNDFGDIIIRGTPKSLSKFIRNMEPCPSGWISIKLVPDSEIKMDDKVQFIIGKEDTVGVIDYP